MTVGGGPTAILTVEDVSQVGHVRRAAQHLAQRIGLSDTDAGRVALSATELASNMIKHAGGGELYLQRVPGNEVGVELLAVDKGPGLDLGTCVADGFSTQGTQGIGLGAVVRQASVFDAYSDVRGSVILSRIYDGRAPVQDMALGVCQYALHGSSACGDAWQVALADGNVSAVVIDGLGHGPEAEYAAKAGVDAFLRSPFGDPPALLQALHAAMTGTRGGAAAVARYTGHDATLHFAGVGNIAARLLGAGVSRGLVSMPGILGVNHRKAQCFSYTQVAGNLLILHSDGLQSRWNITDYPGLGHKHPAVIAALLHRDFRRRTDDVTILVLPLGNAHVQSN
ncbi:SpoIIE family protein phosphatase [Dyella jejuensis]|uniref:SpoIIE family protein phosphatase n=1 Tax=Dyella jejuensis TaxID=1432009 RepID=A0ABW8JP04_9GAMM